MARSASALRRSAGLALACATVALGGCDSTFDQNARAKLAATREIASRESQLVAEPSDVVAVEGVTLLRDAGSTAAVVTLRSTAKAPLTDVPITVGVRRRGERVVLNKAPELGWFQTHAAVIAPGVESTWVFRSPPGRGSKRGDRPYAVAGRPTPPIVSSAERVPVLRSSVAQATPATTTPGSSPETSLATTPLASTPPGTTPQGASPLVPVRVENTSGVPQFGLQVSVLVRDGERLVGAGVTSVEALERDAVQVVAVPVTGSAVGTITTFTTPTIFN